MSNWVALPVVLPMVTAVLLVPLESRPALQRVVGWFSAIALLAATTGILLAQRDGPPLALALGSWRPGLGIVWVIDRFSAMLLVLASTLSLATLHFARPSLRPEEARFFFPLQQLLLAGVNGAFVTADFFNLFVFFEVLLVASFALLAAGGRPRQLAEALPYVLISLVASAFLLLSVGLLYGTAGTVNMAELSQRVAAGPLPATFWAAVALLLVVFCIKAAALPFFFWLPDSYPQAPRAVSPFFAGLLTKVGIYALYRTVPLLSPAPHPPALDHLLLTLGAATMLVGVLCALGRSAIGDILFFHIVSQIGYMVFALGLDSNLGLAAGIFFLAHNIVVKPALVYAGNAVALLTGSDTLGRARGLARSAPLLATAFFVSALSLAGLPPLSGFWGKLFLIRAALEKGAWVTTAVALLVSLLTLASMLKIWSAVFWGAPQGSPAPSAATRRAAQAAPAGLALLAVAMGLAASPLMDWSLRAARQLHAPSAYRHAVLAARGTGAADAPAPLAARQTPRSLP